MNFWNHHRTPRIVWHQPMGNLAVGIVFYHRDDNPARERVWPIGRLARVHFQHGRLRWWFEALRHNKSKPFAKLFVGTGNLMPLTRLSSCQLLADMQKNYQEHRVFDIRGQKPFTWIGWMQNNMCPSLYQFCCSAIRSLALKYSNSWRLCEPKNIYCECSECSESACSNDPLQLCRAKPI